MADNYKDAKKEFYDDMTRKEDSGAVDLGEDQAQKYMLLYYAFGVRCNDEIGADRASRVREKMDLDFDLHQLGKWDQHLEIETILGHMMTIWSEHKDTVSFIQNHIDYMKYIWMKFYPDIVTSHAQG